MHGGVLGVRGRPDFSRFDPRPGRSHFSNFGPPAERRPGGEGGSSLRRTDVLQAYLVGHEGRWATLAD